MAVAVPFADGRERALAEDTFGPGLPLAVAYANLLADQGVAWGLLGPREVGRLWSRHLINAAALAPLVPPGIELMDVGSGAGLPGIPLRLARPDLRISLLEPLQRRVRFLELCRRELALPDVSVVAARAEQVEGRPVADVVTARAVAPLVRLLPTTWPLVRPGGQLLALKGRTAEQELAACEFPGDLSEPPDVVRRCATGGHPLVTVVRFRRTG